MRSGRQVSLKSAMRSATEDTMPVSQLLNWAEAMGIDSIGPLARRDRKLLRTQRNAPVMGGLRFRLCAAHVSRPRAA